MRFAPCHPDRKLQARDRCGSCYEKWLRKNNPAYAERQRANNRRWVALNPERYKTVQRRRVQNVVSKRASALRRKFGIALADYDSMLAAQGGVCAICERPPVAGKSLDVDHDHATGTVRGLLCRGCNTLAGHVEKRWATIEAVRACLETHPKLDDRVKRETA